MDGPWYAWRSCWFNWLYFRVVPSHAVELTSAYLDRAVAGALARHGIRRATPAQKENLAALIHLCGAGIGERYARRGLRLSPGLRCGDHGAKHYVTKREPDEARVRGDSRLSRSASDSGSRLRSEEFERARQLGGYARARARAVSVARISQRLLRFPLESEGADQVVDVRAREVEARAALGDVPVGLVERVAQQLGLEAARLLLEGHR